jgi:hypothetical protein
MTYEGTVQNGVVVFSGGQALPEGTAVRILPEARWTSAKDADPRTIWQKLADLGREVEAAPCDLPSDLAANHDHYLHGLPKRQ